MSDDARDVNALDEEYEPDIITLEDEGGQEHMFEVLDAAEMDDVRYLAVVPYSEDPAQRLAEDAEMLVMRLGYNGDEEYLDLVDDEDELYRTGQMFINRLSEVYNIDLQELEKQLLQEESDE